MLKLRNQSGSAMTEFVLVIPLVLVLILLTLEFSYMMIEKHMLNSAVWSAARLGIKSVQEISDPLSELPLAHKSPLKDIDEQDCPDELKEKMHRKIVFKMASVAPTATSLLSKLGIPPMGLGVDSGFGRLARIANGYVPAFLLTSIETCKISKNGIELGARFFRSGKFPWAGNIVWSLWVMNQFFNSFFDKHKIIGKSVLHATLDYNFFGISLSSPLVDDIASKVRRKIKEIESKITKLKNMNLGADKIQKFLGKEIASWFRADKYIGGVANAVNSKLEKAIGAINAGMNLLNTKLNSQSGLLTTIMYAIPDFLRVVPLRQTVYLTWEAQNIKNVNNELWSGMNLLISPYMSNGDGENFELWEKWIKHLVTYNPDWKTKREYLEKP